MPRKKVAAATVLKSWEEVDASLKELGEVTRHIQAAESKASARKAKIDQTLADDTAEGLARKARLDTDIEAYTRANADQLDGRSRVLQFGTVALRYTKALGTLPKITWATVVERIQNAGRPKAFLTTKVSVNKDAVKAAALDDEQLKYLGMRNKASDAFSYELADLEAKSTA